MAFSSAVFLFAFLPLVYIVYIILSRITKTNICVLNGFLVFASLLFYAYGEPIFVIVMIGSVFVNVVLAGRIVHSAGHKKLYLIAGVILDIGLLAAFKYLGFISENIIAIFGLHYEPVNIHLPIGISFFTFQILSYLIDVYRDESMYQKSPWKVLLYVSFFPQLIAGPIIKYHDVRQWIDNRKLTSPEAAQGVQRFVIGLSKKVLIANSLGKFVDVVYGMSYNELPTAYAWLGAVLYALQIYYDFSGYSDMAIGLGHMFGFTFAENFNNPFQSCSIREFWKRWHISLSSWFREYLYIPLGGNRKGRFNTEKNKLIVFFLTGLWHGASWNFVLWGMIHGVSLVAEDLLLRKKELAKRLKWIGWIYTTIIVCIAFVWFRADTFGQGCSFFVRMFCGNPVSNAAYGQIIPFLTPFFLLIVIAAIAGCLPFVRKIKIKTGGYVLSILLYILCLCAIAGEAYNPFIYFRF